ncbi:hypothetical protein ACQ4PT_055142 [Festuca glaucescens]
MSGRRESRGGGREDDRKLVAPGRDRDAGGDDEDDGRRDRMPGCLGLFAGWKKRHATTSARTGRVAAAPPPPPQPRAKELKEVPARSEDQEHPVETLPAVIEAQELPAEIESLIVSKIPSIYDRWSLQRVCGRWRSAALNCERAPLPLIVNADYTLSNYFAEGADCVPQKMNQLVEHPASHPSTCLGSLDNWIVIGYEAEFDPQENLHPIHDECCLVQPIKGGIVDLASPCSSRCRGRSSSLQVEDWDGTFSYSQPARAYRLRLQKVSLCRSHGCANFKIAGLASQGAQNHIIFCTPECKVWTISSAGFITMGSDIQFFQEKLFVLGGNQTDLFMIDFGPHMCLFPTVSRVRRCAAIDPLILNDTIQQKNLVQSEEHLLLVVRYLTLNWDQLVAVRVFQFDTDSRTWTEKQSIGSMTILISLSSSECFDASDRKEIKSDHIYFLDIFARSFCR